MLPVDIKARTRDRGTGMVKRSQRAERVLRVCTHSVYWRQPTEQKELQELRAIAEKSSRQWTQDDYMDNTHDMLFKYCAQGSTKSDQMSRLYALLQRLTPEALKMVYGENFEEEFHQENQYSDHTLYHSCNTLVHGMREDPKDCWFTILARRVLLRHLLWCEEAGADPRGEASPDVEVPQESPSDDMWVPRDGPAHHVSPKKRWLGKWKEENTHVPPAKRPMPYKSNSSESVGSKTDEIDLCHSAQHTLEGNVLECLLPDTVSGFIHYTPPMVNPPQEKYSIVLVSLPPWLDQYRN